MKWPLRYLVNCVKWGFTQWRIHQAIVGVIVVVGGLVFKDWFSAHRSAIPWYLIGWLAFYTFVVAPAWLWHQLDEKLLSTDQPRPLVVIDGHEATYVEDSNTGQRGLVDLLRIVNRGNSPAVNIEIPAIPYHNRTASLFRPLPTTLGPGQSTDAHILGLERVLREVNKDTPKVRGCPWSIRIPLTVKYRDPNHGQWTTDHAIIFDAGGIRFNIVHPDEPEEWADAFVLQ